MGNGVVATPRRTSRVRRGAQRAAVGQKRFLTNKRWFAIHGWVGVQLGVMLFVVLFSGSLATVAHEIDWLLNPSMRVTPAEEPLPVEQLVETARSRYPEQHVWFVYLPTNPYFAAEVQLLTPGQEDFTQAVRRLYMDPYTGSIQGESGWFTIQRALRNFHMNLSLPVFGIYVVCAFAFALLASIVSALFFYKRWWRRFFILRLRKGARVFWSDAHRAAGLWSLWFTLVIAVTGIWYFIEMGMFDAGIGLSDIPEAWPTIEIAADSQAQWRPVTDIVAAAREVYPELRISALFFPTTAGEAVRIYGQGDAWLVRDRANNVFVNPYTAEAMGVYRAEDIPLAYRWAHTADPLHFGDFGGLISKLIWLFFGLSSSALTLTGVYLWARRLRRDGAQGRRVARS